MDNKLISAFITSISSVKLVDTKYGPRGVAEICFHGMPKKTFWVSPKQCDNIRKIFDFLKNGNGYSTNVREAHCILEETDKGYRYVWGGVHTTRKSDLKWLEEKFGVEFKSPYIGRYDIKKDEAIEVAAHLLDE